MAIQASGIISGLDVANLIKASVAYEQAPIDRAQKQLSSTSGQISAMGKVKSAIADLQEAAKKLSDTSNLYSFKGSFGNADLGEVTLSKDAAAGNYQIDVQQLATSHKLAASNVDTQNGGSLRIELGSVAGGAFTAKTGSSAIDVNIQPNASLSDVAKAINNADGGVSATVINGQNGQQLVLTSKETGESNQIKVTSSMGGLNFDPTNPTASGGMQQVSAAQDAIVEIDGIAVHSASNTVKDAVTGVDLTLKATGTTQLAINSDNSELENLTKAFVEAYNKARSTMKELTKYDAEGKNSGALNGDSTVSSALNQLRGALSAVPQGASDAYKLLSDLGVKTNADGSLSFDADKLKSAARDDFGAAAKTIAAYGSAFDTLTTKLNETGGLIDNRISGLNSTSTRLKDNIAALQQRLETATKRYEKQFAGLESLMSSMSSTGNMLSRQLSSLL